MRRLKVFKRGIMGHQRYGCIICIVIIANTLQLDTFFSFPMNFCLNSECSRDTLNSTAIVLNNSLELILQIIDVEKIYWPHTSFTLRIVLPKDETITSCCYNDSSYTQTVAMNLPIMPIVNIDTNHSTQYLAPRTRKNFIRRHDLFSFFTVVKVSTKSDLKMYNDVIRHSINPRRDYVIFIHAPAQTVESEELLISLRTLQGLRNKIVISCCDGTGIWVDPIHFTGDMIHISSITEKQVAPPMGKNLRGRHLVASVSEAPPYTFKSGDDVNGRAIIEGSLCKIFTEASKKFNYTHVINYDGNDYGTLHPNGTWTGSYSKIHYKVYDMVLISASDLLWDRQDVGSIASYIDIIFGVSPPAYTKHWYTFLLPFEPEVWVWMCVTFSLICIVQGIVMYLIHGRKFKPIVMDSTGILPFAMTMEQGLQNIPVGMRYFSLILLMGCTILGTAYKSTLRTHIMFPLPDSIPTTFEELADRSDYSVTLTVTGQIEKHFFASSKDPKVKKLRERLVEVNSWENCFKTAFLEAKHACIYWNTGKGIVMKNMTLNATVEPLVYSKDAAIRNFLSFGFQENSIYVDSFSRILGTPASIGIVKKWEEDIWDSFKKEGRKNMLKQEGTPVFKKLMMLANSKNDNEQ